MARLNKTADMIKAYRRFLVSQTSKPTGDEHRISSKLADFLDHQIMVRWCLSMMYQMLETLLCHCGGVDLIGLTQLV